MPLTAAAGAIAKPEQLAREMLAASSNAQTWLGAGSAAAALERIHGASLPPPAAGQPEHTADELANYRPFALVYLPPNGLTADHDNTGAPPGWRHAGDVLIELEQNTPAALRTETLASPNAETSNTHEAHRQWANTVGQIFADLQTLAAEQNHLSLLSIAVETPPNRNHPRQWEHTGDTQFAVLRLVFGAR